MGFVDVGILLLTYSGSYLCYENLYYTKISFQYCMPFKIYKKKKKGKEILVKQQFQTLSISLVTAELDISICLFKENKYLFI